MQKKIKILAIISSVILYVTGLYGQVTEKAIVMNCPEEKMEVLVSQESLLTGELLWFKVYCTSSLFPNEELSSLAFVELVSSSNASVLRKKILLKHGEGSGEFSIPDNLQTGMYHIIAYTNWMKNFGEASFFRKEIVIINPWLPFDKVQDRNDSVKTPLITPAPVNRPESIIVTTDRSSYSPRQNVSLKVESNNNNRGKILNLSISVHRKEPQMIFSAGNAYPVAATVSPGKITWLPDYKGIRLTGKLSDASDNAISGAYVTESAIGKGTEIKQSQTDSEGNFSFLLKPGEGEKEVVLTLPAEEEKVNLEESFWNGFRNPPSGNALTLNQEALSFLKEKFSHFQLQSRFKRQNYLRTPAETIDADSTVFYSKPYQLINLEKYVMLDSLREYFYELVPSVRFGQRRGVLDISVRDSVSQTFYDQEPGVFVDGVLYNDYTQIARIPVREIDHIAILPKIYYYRDFTFGGIIDIHTKKSDFNSVKPLPVMNRIIYPLGETSEWKFTSPDYSLQSSGDRSPDFRYLLYWNPEIKSANSELKFYTGDVKGNFVISIMGLSSDGAILKGEREIVVE